MNLDCVMVTCNLPEEPVAGDRFQIAGEMIVTGTRRAIVDITSYGGRRESVLGDLEVECALHLEVCDTESDAR